MEYEYIDNDKSLVVFYTNHKTVKWIAFDCEFKKINENKKPLSVITVKSDLGLFIIDCLLTDFLDGFTQMLIDKNILKITHSGINDYEIFYKLNGILPQNVVDTQFIAPFLDFSINSSLEKLLQKYLNCTIKKNQSVTEWKRRPLTIEQKEYAINDVLHLDRLYEEMSILLESKGRTSWAFDKCKELCCEDTYRKSELDKLISTRELSKLPKMKVIFLIRLLKWQIEYAFVSEKELFKKRYMTDLLRTVEHGKKCMLEDQRVIGNKKVIKHIDDILRMYSNPATIEEEYNFDKIIQDSEQKTKRSNSIDILYYLVQDKCIDMKIHTSVLLQKNDLSKLKNIRSYIDTHFKENWKREILGQDLLNMIRHVENFNYKIEGNNCVINFETN